MSCNDFRDWTATRDRMGPGEPTLRIDGKCTCDSGGHNVFLKPVSDGIVDDPEVVTYQVVVEEPTGSSTTDMPTVEIHHEERADEKAAHVLLRLPEGDPMRVDIQDVS